MRKFLTVGVLLASFAITDTAAAHGDISCEAVPRAERKSSAELQKLLKSKGWTIRKIQMFNNCYEVYGFDQNKRPVEAFFHPRTLERVE